MGYSSKIFNISDLSDQVKKWKSAGLKVVFTNGCFDLLHVGHVDYLEKAKALGDILLVAVNADHSVKKLKGIHRPIQDEYSRMAIIAALESVDGVVLFHEDTPYEIISLLLPDVLCKGGDWKIEDIIGSDLVSNNGGKIVSIPFISGYSTTLIEQKIKSNR